MGLDLQESTMGQEVTEIYQKAPGKQSPGLESLLDGDALARLLDVTGASRKLAYSTEPCVSTFSKSVT